MLKGHLLNDRYQVKDAVGGGGMANVYLAHDTILDREVAIKVLRLEYANDDEFIARFHREAHSATSLSHPNIVNIYDVGEEEDIYYMVMEYVDGMTLKQYIQKYGPIDVKKSLNIMKQITTAITHAHENDIVHRDIKPQNILIDDRMNVKVTDFGIAMALSATSLTQTNSVLGSVHYLSPEQARGGMATKKSDIYSLGIVLFEMLTGRLPFSGQSAVSIALKHLQSETPSLQRWNPDVPQSVENIVLRATAKDPFHRYEDISEMVSDLETAMHPERLNEEKFTPPLEDDDEVTKAIPIITNESYKDHHVDDTIVHQNEEPVEGYPQKRKKRISKWLLWTFLLFIGVGMAALFILPRLMPEDVKILDVSGMEYEEALSELSAINLKVNRETMYSDEVAEGHIIKTDPEAGMVVKEGATVTLYSSQGKKKVDFDDYVKEQYNRVKRLLEARGYKNVISYEKNSSKPVGEIITQIQPTPGDKVIPENTTVIFEISKGPPLVMLQTLKGMTEKEAHEYIQKENLSMNTIREYSDEVAEGYVIRQDPPPYQQVPEKTEIDVYISKGPKEKPPINKEVTFTVPIDEDKSIQFQEVRIYIEDMNNDITELYKRDFINDDKEYKVQLTIPPDKEAKYKVMRDDQVYITETVPYKEGEGE